ncbi:antitermination protein [Salmonella enterica subsp. enterica serovar Newport]|uniref:Antitermination protein n=1 Tax=Salmonella enterica I TaxID=59201 RepID=A0A3V2NXM8_SALET|nr:antitermination protein [Salmonella enterica subsp. enterica serovar Newport]EBS0250491.1 antitermination protein [Salmonella enterica subsp. enterica serovar Give]EBZ2215224.1 antitermination protein [Salmonella enterica subsp. enterica serovar Montevideo]EHW6507529.1 antitermination protein [Salmonella enterica]EBR9096693.1 antitermination protein [Salmonella enterica subsp. enterica serovar Newport]
MEITKERLLEIANLSDRVLSDGRIISPDAYESVTSIEITTMARMLLGYFKIENKKQMDGNANIYDILDGWGAWAAAGNSSIKWRQVADKYRDVVPYGKKSRRQCNNDEGRMIDEWVLKLRQYKNDEYELIIAHFVIGISLRKIAKKKKCADGTIRKKLQAVMGLLEGMLMS